MHAIRFEFIKQLDFYSQLTTVNTLKINGIGLEKFEIIDKEKKSRFFDKIFFLANFSIDTILRMLFFLL